MSTKQDEQGAEAQASDSPGNPPGAPKRAASMGLGVLAVVVLIGSGTTLLAVESCAQPIEPQGPAAQPTTVKTPPTATQPTAPGRALLGKLQHPR